MEICFNETWGTICDGLWSTADANVACRQLGYSATGKFSMIMIHYDIPNSNNKN